VSEAKGRRFLALVLILTAVRLVFAAVIPLSEDEAYYRLWSLYPQAGYLDHPPVIAWQIWASRWLAGDGPLGVRLPAVLDSALTSLLVFDIARLLGASDEGAYRAGLWLNATLLIGAAAILATPDAPATLFWSATVWSLLRAMASGRLAWWAAAGVAAGLASLSKYSSLFLAPGVLLWLLASKDRRGQLLRPGPWLAAALAVGLFGINLAWNAQHHWLTFGKQFGRAVPEGFAPAHLVELLVGQALLLNPLLTAFLWLALVRRGQAGLGARIIAPLAWITAPFGLYLLLHALHARVQAHWPAPIYPALATIAAFAAEDPGLSAGWRRVRLAVPWLGFGLTSLLLIHLAVPATDVSARDPARQLRGWPQFAGRIERLRLASGAGWVGTVSYGAAAQLQAQGRIAAPVMQITERERYSFLPASARPPARGAGVIVDLGRRLDAKMLAECFDRVAPLGRIVRQPGPAGAYSAYRVEGWKYPEDEGCGREDPSRGTPRTRQARPSPP
jgi:4-amino-4-deoxy-L-arabinose transferase-like glycosyltransferase